MLFYDLYIDSHQHRFWFPFSPSLQFI